MPAESSSTRSDAGDSAAATGGFGSVRAALPAEHMRPRLVCSHPRLRRTDGRLRLLSIGWVGRGEADPLVLDALARGRICDRVIATG